MKLSHFSSKTLRKKDLYSVDVQPSNSMKPCGFWVSVDGEKDWPTWCLMEEFGNPNRQNHYRVTLDFNYNILILKTEQDVRDFVKQYGVLTSWGHFYDINWLKVSKKYDGIILQDYFYGLRMEQLWYRSWDCASGCIWNHKAIKSLRLLRGKAND